MQLVFLHGIRVLCGDDQWLKHSFIGYTGFLELVQHLLSTARLGQFGGIANQRTDIDSAFIRQRDQYISVSCEAVPNLRYPWTWRLRTLF